MHASTPPLEMEDGGAETNTKTFKLLIVSSSQPPPPFFLKMEWTETNTYSI